MAEEKAILPVKETKHRLKHGKSTLDYIAKAGWLKVGDEDQPDAEIFFSYYRTSGRGASKRPLTFVFNGGPGAASAYLHVGMVGPKRLVTNDDGSLAPSPAQLVDNAQSWLFFTDLVFIDPVGTGLSRMVPANGDEEKKTDKKYYWKVDKDLDSINRFVDLFLSTEGRWNSPLYLAGESYGGYRAGRLARRMQEKAGIGLNGVILISPVLEWDCLLATKYSAQSFAILFPSYAASAYSHGLAKSGKSDRSLEAFLQDAEEFALSELLPALTPRRGGREHDKSFWQRMSDFCGIEPEFLRRRNGRLDFTVFCKELLRKQGKVAGLYDTLVTSEDPFPAEHDFKGVDPTLGGLNRAFAAAVNTQVRQNLGVESIERYELLSYEVNESWAWSESKGDAVPPGTADDLAVALAMNPDMKIVISHGYHDLITPYFDTDYIIAQLQETSPVAEAISIQHYPGGHMFYTHKKSREAFFKDIKKLYA